MPRIAAYNALQDHFGREQAQVLAEFVESQDGPDLSQFATKGDLKDLELRLTKDLATLREEIGSSREEFKGEIASLRVEFKSEIAKTREEMLTRMNWAVIIQVLTTVGALVTLAKLI